MYLLCKQQDGYFFHLQTILLNYTVSISTIAIIIFHPHFITSSLSFCSSIYITFMETGLVHMAQEVVWPKDLSRAVHYFPNSLLFFLSWLYCSVWLWVFIRAYFFPWYDSAHTGPFTVPKVLEENLIPPLGPTSEPMYWLLPLPTSLPGCLLLVLKSQPRCYHPRDVFSNLCTSTKATPFLLFFIELISIWNYLVCSCDLFILASSTVHTAQEQGPRLSQVSFYPQRLEWHIVGAQNILTEHMVKEVYRELLFMLGQMPPNL